MNKHTHIQTTVPAFLILIGLPFLFWALGAVPKRTLLKESLSMLALLSFTVMLALYLLAPFNRTVFSAIKRSTTLTLHKTLGYLIVAVFICHPFFIVLPRYFESGMEPTEAFLTMITTFESTGIVVGLTSWGLILILGITSLARNVLPMKYTTWRIFHGILAILFTLCALFHAIDLGRHMTPPMAILVILLAAWGILTLIPIRYFNTTRPNTETAS